MGALKISVGQVYTWDPCDFGTDPFSDNTAFVETVLAVSGEWVQYELKYRNDGHEIVRVHSAKIRVFLATRTKVSDPAVK